MVLAAVLELVAPAVVEARIEERVRERTREVAGVSADVDSFPVVTRLLVTGRIRHMTLTLDRLVSQRVTFATVRLTVEGLELDRDVLLRQQEIELRDMETGVLTAELTAEVLSDLVGAPVELRPGQVSVTLGGTAVPAQPEIRDRTLRLGGRRITALSVTLPEELESCTPDLVVQRGRMLLSCRLQELPSLLRDASG